MGPLAATRRANEAAKIYYNGVLQPSNSVSWNGSVAYTGAELDIGRQSDFSNRYFNGVIDEVQIYNRALSEAEIGGFFSSFIPDQAATFSAGTLWETISAPTFIAEGDASRDNKNVRVIGTTLTVNGAHTFKNIELLNGAKLTHSPATTTTEYSLDLTAWTISIDETSSINLDGKGYLGGRGDWEQGRTLGNMLGSNRGAGGGYGGLGGRYDSNWAPNNPYGDLTEPANLGSGGGAWGGDDGGDGGGFLKLNAINIAVDGSIRANGGEGLGGGAAGAGSGGGVNITTKTLSGAGGIHANGGNQRVGGGGGRIAIRYLDLATMDINSVTSQGGLGVNGKAANGTVFIKQEQETGGELIVTGQGPTSPWTDLNIPSGYTFDSLSLRNNARVITYDPIVVTGKVLITGDSILTHNSTNENGLSIQASVVQVDFGSAIDVTGRGYIGGRSDWEQGRTLGNEYGSYRGAGGSYGGLGGKYDVNWNPGGTYGDLTNPLYLGSGGGTWGGDDGGDGGGRITIHASQAVVVNGAIRADGSEGKGGGAAGAGSGGSVLIHTSRLSGDGFITANGGGQRVGGGGGRVAIYCDYVEADHNFGNLYNITALRGRGVNDTRKASAGTVYIRYSNQANGDLYIDDNVVDGSGVPNGTSPESTPLTLIGYGLTKSVTSVIRWRRTVL